MSRNGRMTPEAYEEWRRGKMCGPPDHPKIRYGDRSRAKAVARRLSRSDEKMSDYKCDYCGQFHVGHKSVKSYAEWAAVDNRGVTDDDLLIDIERQAAIDAATDDELFELMDAEEISR